MSSFKLLALLGYLNINGSAIMLVLLVLSRFAARSLLLCALLNFSRAVLFRRFDDKE
jgi:hypothetical protein